MVGRVCLGLIPLSRIQYLDTLTKSGRILLSEWSAQLVAYVVDSPVPILVYKVVSVKTKYRC